MSKPLGLSHAPRYIPRYRPNPSPGQQPAFLPQRGVRGIAAIKLDLRRRALQTALCFASFQTSLHGRYIPRDPTPGRASDPFFAIASSFKLGLRRRALRTALVLKSCDFRAGAAALRCSAPHCATDTVTCQDMFSRYRPA